MVGKWPNTYAFTKAISEDMVRSYAKDLPIAIFRPAIGMHMLNDFDLFYFSKPGKCFYF